MGSAIVGAAAAGATKPLAEEAGKTGRYIIEKDPDVAIVPMKMVGYSAGGFIALVFLLMIAGLLYLVIRWVL